MYVCMFFVCIYDCTAKECAKTATSKSRGGPDGLGELASSASVAAQMAWKKLPKFDPEPVEEKNMDMNMNMPALTGRVGEILGVLQHKVKPGQDQTSEPAVQSTTPQNEHILPEHVTCSK